MKLLKLLNNASNRSLYIAIAIIYFLLIANISTMPKRGYALDENILANASVETVVSGTPAGWAQAGWGNNQRTHEVVPGAHTGSNAVKVTVANYVNGDARWNPPTVAASAGQIFEYSDWYMASAPTHINVAIELQNGTIMYDWLATLAPSNTWTQVNAQYTMPANAKAATFYHLISENGSLTTDDYSVSIQSPVTSIPTEPTNPSANMIGNASMEQSSTNSISGWAGNSWGSLQPTFTAVKGQAQDGTTASRVSVTNYSSGDAKWWFTPVAVVPGKTYTISDWYRSDSSTQMVAAATLNTGTIQYIWLGDIAPATNWTQFQANWTAPANATQVTMFHLIRSNGWLETDTFQMNEIAPTPTDPTPTPTPNPTPAGTGMVSIEFDDGWQSAYQYGLPLVERFGWKATQYIITDTAVHNADYGVGTYMTPAQIQDWNQRGDIGSHSVDHRDIATLSNAQKTAELRDSDTYLTNLLGEAVNLYASPYCSSSASVVSIAKLYYQDVRNCDGGVNYKNSFDRWNVDCFIILNTTTDAEIRAAISDAKANNGWLVLVWHEVDGDTKNDWSVSQQTLQRQLQLVKDSGIEVVSSQDALNRISN